jgi:uncharacterized protein with NAD-binding domain and iron-sulfur cluster
MRMTTMTTTTTMRTTMSRRTKPLSRMFLGTMACACILLLLELTTQVEAFGMVQVAPTLKGSTSSRTSISSKSPAYYEKGPRPRPRPRSSSMLVVDNNGHGLLVLRSTMAVNGDGDGMDDNDNKVDINVDDVSMQQQEQEAAVASTTAATTAAAAAPQEKKKQKKTRKIAIIGAGWGGLSAAHALSKVHHEQSSDTDSEDVELEITVIEANGRVGGVVRDGFTTLTGNRPAEAGQHGFWNNYSNVYRLFLEEIQHGFSIDTALTQYAAQGQYSPRGLEAVWPVYRDQDLQLPTGLAQAAYTKFLNLPWTDKLTAVPLVAAFCDFDDSAEAWQRYDVVSFRDLCVKLGVSRRCYDEAFEPMILTGLFAPGAECSAAAALGMAYFFVLQSQQAFDVQWCRGNIGTVVFDPWVATMQDNGVAFATSTRVTGFDMDPPNGVRDTVNPAISSLQCTRDDGSTYDMPVDEVIFAVGAKALNSFVKFCPELAALPEFRRFANLRGTSVLATRLFLDRHVSIKYSANACWGFDPGVGMTVFDIRALHGVNASTVADAPGSVMEVDYYHAATLLVLSDDEIVRKAKADLDTILGTTCQGASVTDAAVVRLPEGVNWYFPGSYADMPDLKSSSLDNVYFAGDIVRTRHGSWSQEKAFVTGLQAANLLLDRPVDQNVLPVPADEGHVQFGKKVFRMFQSMLGGGRGGDVSKGGPLFSLVDFLW